MGYLNDNRRKGQLAFICHDLYGYVLQVFQGFKTINQLSGILADEFPDRETWQYSGIRRCPLPAVGRKSPRINPVMATYRPDPYVRPRQPTVVQYGFNSAALRAQAISRFTAELVTVARIFNEPSVATP